MPNEPVPDPKAFHDFERAGWESNVSEYVNAYARLTRQTVEPLLEAAGAGPGIRLLDVATGPGHVAGRAAASGARVVGIDFSAPMIERARGNHPGVEFQLGDAEELSFADASFDAVVMNFGMLHLARPERAMAEAARVLVAGGKFAFTVWDKPEAAVGFGMVLQAIQTHGNPAVGLPEGPPFFRFSDPAESERALQAAGLAEVNVARLPLIWHFDAPEEVFEAILRGGVRTSAILRAQTPEAFEAIRAATLGAVQEFVGRGAVELPMPAMLASATKPAA